MYFRISFLLVLIIPVIAFVWIYRLMAAREKQKALRQIDGLAERYHEFIRKRLTLSYLKEEDWKTEKDIIMDEAKEAMKPDLDALASIILAASYQVSSGDRQHVTFPNLSAATEELLSKRQKPAASVVKEQLYASFEDAMKADLSSKWLDFQVGERLSPQ